MFYELSMGPILWIYMAEILPPIGIGSAVFLKNIFVIIVSLTTPFMIPWSKVGTFLIYGGLTIGGGVFVILFVKET